MEELHSCGVEDVLLEGCIIIFIISYKRNCLTQKFDSSAFLGKIKQAFELDPNLKNLLLDPFFKDAVHNSQVAWRKVVASSAMLGIPTPAFSTALAFYDSYRSARLPANLLQVKYIRYIFCVPHLLHM